MGRLVVVVILIILVGIVALNYKRFVNIVAGGTSIAENSEPPRYSRAPVQLPDHYGLYLEVDGTLTEVTNGNFSAGPAHLEKIPRLLIFDKNIAVIMKQIQLVSLVYVDRAVQFTEREFGHPVLEVTQRRSWDVVGVKSLIIPTVIKPVPNQTEMVWIEPKNSIMKGAYAYYNIQHNPDFGPPPAPDMLLKQTGEGTIYKFFVNMKAPEVADWTEWQCYFYQLGTAAGGFENMMSTTFGWSIVPCEGPTKASALLTQAVQSEQKHDYKNALANYTASIEALDLAVTAKHGQAAEAKQTYAIAYNGRCWVRAITGQDLPMALDDCNKALEFRPGDANTLDSRGLVQFKLSHLEASLADYNSALEKNPKLASSLYVRGITKRRLGNAAGAAADIASASEIQPDIANIFEGYGVAQ